MSLGVLNNINAIYAQNNLNNTSNSLSKVLQQLSSGSKISSGSDDAAGLSLVNGLQANSQALAQSSTNASEGVGLLSVADGALSQVTNLLNRAVTLATEASNGTLNTSQDTAANQEYQSILSEISNIGSTTTYNNTAVFGTKTDIYTGDSSTAGASINSLNIRSLSSSNVGDSSGAMAYSNGTNNVFLDLSKGGVNAAVTDSLGTASNTTTITVGYMTKGANGSAIQSSANISVGAGTTYANTAQGLISAINGSGLGITAAFGTATQAGSGAVQAAEASATAGSTGNDTGIIISGAGIGTGLNSAGEIGSLTTTGAGDALAGTLNIVGSDGKTHNITLGTANSTDTEANLASTINAAGYGVTATVDSTNKILTFTTANSAVSLTGTNLTDAGTATALANVPTTNTQNESEVGTFTFTAAAAGGSVKVGTTTYTTTGGETEAQIAAAINKNSATTGFSAVVDSKTATQLDIFSANSASANMAAGNASDASITAAAPAAALTNSDYYSVKISSAAAITDTSITGSGTANVGFTTDVNGSGGVATISYSDAAGISLSSTDLSTQGDAEATLTALNSAITAVAAQDGYIGAQINTLNSVSSVLSTQAENVTSAQNAVQATDYASATSNMSKYQILSQTGISALAQANSMQQEVTKLLQ